MSSKVLFSLLACLRKEERDTDRSSFLINGSKVLEDLIASFDGKSNPIRNYSADELIKATNNFDASCIMQECRIYKMFSGVLDDRSIIIKKYFTLSWLNENAVRSLAIRDIIISTQMSNHNNVLKLLGCCLEFPIPALVHEYATIGVLNDEGGFGASESLTWKARLGIAKQLANALTYLHTAFPRPIILRDLNFSCIYLGHDYVPKLSYFGLSITIPPMKSYAEDEPKGRFGYLDPAHITSGIISEKGDVYSFGVLLLVFLTGQKAVVTNQDGEYESINSYVKCHTCNGQIQSIVDPKIFGEVGKDEQVQQHLQDFVALALLCTQASNENERPDMINVSKELERIQKSTFPRC
ncbi:hypothetical protein ABKV19_000891 [Rosa sericea]